METFRNSNFELPFELDSVSNHQYPEINISREMYYHSSLSVFQDDANKLLIVPSSESVIKRITRIFFEDGLKTALNEGVAIANSTGNNGFVGLVATQLLKLLHLKEKMRSYIQPYYVPDSDLVTIEKFSPTRNWSKSFIRFISWHPNCFKLAVAACDDTIRIYSCDTMSSTVPILKSHIQKCITSIAWRPYSACEIAVGCQSGALVWTLDPISQSTRPLSQGNLLKVNKHFPITCLEWNWDGSLLATASINDSDILIWDVCQNKNVPLKRTGPPCSLLKWSPDGTRLYTGTVGNTFRVWDVYNWKPDRWCIPKGSIISACWSPCSSYLVFITNNESTLYCLSFIDDFGDGKTQKEALAVANFSRMDIDGVEIGRSPHSIAWCWPGSRLAVMFNDSKFIAIFYISVHANLVNIAPDTLISGIGAEIPAHICFKNDKLKSQSSILTVGWSSGRVQYVTFY